MTRFVMCVALILMSAPSRVRAQDVGEIALIPDNDQIIDSAGSPTRYLQRASCAFFATHADQYDAIFVFTSAQLNFLTRVQQGWPVKNAAQGIGRDGWPTIGNYCSQRLRQAVKMGDIDSFAEDPDAEYDGVAFFSLSGIELMAHEFGHQWMASIRFDLGDGVHHCLARGHEDNSGGDSGGTTGMECDGYPLSSFNQHWSYFFNTGSVMYGNTIRDLGSGMFEVSNPAAKYSELDQYLMGLRDPSEVSPMFLVDTGDILGSASFPIARGQTEIISGTRLDFTVQDIIRVEGPRIPARDACHWKGAFMIVHPVGAPPTAAQIALVDRYRQRWESFYSDATDQRGSFDTTLAGGGQGTSTCPANNSPPVDGGMAALDAGMSPMPDAGSRATPDADTFEEAPDAMTIDPDAGTPIPRVDTPDASDPRAPRGVVGLDDGCGCSAVPSRSASTALSAIAVLMLLTRRKRLNCR
jgi:MYXO-CTERM domain-containing protein